SPQGIAVLDLSVEAPWVVPVADQDHPELATQTIGSIQVKNVEARGNFLPDPVEIASASLAIDSGMVEGTNAQVQFHRIPVRASVRYPVNCMAASAPAPSSAPSPTPCPVQFALDAGAIDAAALQSAVM